MKKICVAGAGAIGGTIAARLACAGHDVTVFARNATLAALRQGELVLHDVSGESRVVVRASDQADFGVQDVIFVCAKAHALPALMVQIAPLIGPDTIVIPAVNGVPWWYFQSLDARFPGRAVEAVDPDGALLAMLPPTQLLGAVVYITAEAVAPGVVRSSNPHRLILGELDDTLSPRLLKICEMLSGAGIATQPSTHIRDDVWVKVAANLTSNPLSVVTRATLDDIYGDGDLHEIVVGMLHEVTLVAASYGARLLFDPRQFLAKGQSMGAFRTSMLQDHEKGYPLEIAAIVEAVLELAAHYAIPMPITKLVLGLTRYASKKR
jgi:2-dehydropantoate 2-reductase